MATHGDIGVSQPAASTITMKVRTVTQDMNSTVVHQEVLTVGDANSSLGLMPVIASAPNSTSYAAAVRIVSGPSTATDFAVRALLPSTAADNPVVATIGTNLQSSATANSNSSALNVRVVGGVSSAVDFQARVNQGIGNSSAGDRWRVNAQNSSASDYIPVRIVNSSGDGYAPLSQDYVHDSTLTASTVAGPVVILRASATAPTAVSSDDRFVAQWALRNGAAVTALSDTGGILINASTSYHSTNHAFPGLNVRPVTPASQGVSSTVVSTNSTAFYEILSSMTGQARRVYAYSLTSTAVATFGVEFMSGTNTVLWAVDIGSASSGVTGANLAVGAPSYLFTTALDAPLNVRLGSTGVQVRISVGSYNSD